MASFDDAWTRIANRKLKQMKTARRKRLLKRFVSGKGIKYFNFILIAVCLFILMAIYNLPPFHAAIIVIFLSLFNFIEGLYR